MYTTDPGSPEANPGHVNQECKDVRLGNDAHQPIASHDRKFSNHVLSKNEHTLSKRFLFLNCNNFWDHPMQRNHDGTTLVRSRLSIHGIMREKAVTSNAYYGIAHTWMRHTTFINRGKSGDFYTHHFFRDLLSFHYHIIMPIAR